MHSTSLSLASPRASIGLGRELLLGRTGGWRWAALALALLAASLCCYAFLRRASSFIAPEAFVRCDNVWPILVGTHHKTGTVLLQHIFKDACPILGWRCAFNDIPVRCKSPQAARAAGLHLCFNQHGVRFKLAGSESYRFIHAVRDPLETVLSGYQYHLKTTERWASRPDVRYNGTSYREYLNSLPLRDGLRAEVKHALRDSLKTMPRLTNRTAANPCTLTVRLEDFSSDWEGTIARMWDLLGVRDRSTFERLMAQVSVHNVYSKGSRRYNKHVSNASSTRGKLRSMLKDMPDVYQQVQRVRRRIHYPIVGREETA